MSYVRFSDAELRRLAGGDRTIRRGRPDDARAKFKCPVSALNHEERHIMQRRRQLKAQAGPSVNSISATSVHRADDVDQLITEVLANSSRVVVLDDTMDDEGTGFNDARAAALASALRHNRSIVAISLRGVHVTEIGITSICESLKRNKGVRALELHLVGLTPKSMRAILSLVATNSNIISVSLSRTGADDDPLADLIDETVRVNRMLLADPKMNQYENWLFAVRNGEDADGMAWDAESDEGDEHMMQAEAQAFAAASGKLARPVCNHYLQGACTYGSRCRHYHPDRLATEQETAGMDRRPAASALDDDPAFTAPDVGGLVRALQSERDRDFAVYWSNVFQWATVLVAAGTVGWLLVTRGTALRLRGACSG